MLSLRLRLGSIFFFLRLTRWLSVLFGRIWLYGRLRITIRWCFRSFVISLEYFIDTDGDDRVVIESYFNELGYDLPADYGAWSFFGKDGTIVTRQFFAQLGVHFVFVS